MRNNGTQQWVLPPWRSCPSCRSCADTAERPRTALAPPWRRTPPPLQQNHLPVSPAVITGFLLLSALISRFFVWRVQQVDEGWVDSHFIYTAVLASHHHFYYTRMGKAHSFLVSSLLYKIRVTHKHTCTYMQKSFWSKVDVSLHKHTCHALSSVWQYLSLTAGSPQAHMPCTQ